MYSCPCVFAYPESLLVIKTNDGWGGAQTAPRLCHLSHRKPDTPEPTLCCFPSLPHSTHTHTNISPLHPNDHFSGGSMSAIGVIITKSAHYMCLQVGNRTVAPTCHVHTISNRQTDRHLKQQSIHTPYPSIHTSYPRRIPSPHPAVPWLSLPLINLVTFML